MEIDKREIMTSVQSHLSVIGKRAKDEQGNSLWSQITATSPEMVVVREYIDSGMDKVLEVLRDIVVGIRPVQEETKDDTSGTGVRLEDADVVKVEFSNSRWSAKDKEGFEKAFPSMCKRFVTSYAVAEFLGMFAPQYAKKYEVEELSILDGIKAIGMIKVPATSEKSFDAISGSVI